MDAEQVLRSAQCEDAPFDDEIPKQLHALNNPRAFVRWCRPLLQATLRAQQAPGQSS